MSLCKEQRGAAHNICNSKYSVFKNNPIAFHNGSNNDSNFIIKLLAEEFEKQFTCSIEIEKEATRNGKNGEKITKNIVYRLQFIDIARFMGRSVIVIVLVWILWKWKKMY